MLAGPDRCATRARDLTCVRRERAQAGDGAPSLSWLATVEPDSTQITAGTPGGHGRGAPAVRDYGRETYSTALARLGLARGARRPLHARPVPRGAPPSDRVASNWCHQEGSLRAAPWPWGSRRRAA